jgi:serine/threonine protein kinase/tetratricopeptide (TPR) repeat protein
MGDNTKPESETIDVSAADQMRSLCAQFDEECETAARAGTPPRLEAYVARVPETERANFRAELQRIQQRRQHTQVQSDEAPLDVTAERPPGIEGGDTAQTGDHGTIDYSPHPPSERTPTMQDVTMDATPALQSAHLGDQPMVPGYEIVGELGRGGMGVVYKARQRGLNRWVALKMVLAGAHAGASQLARFHTEAEAVARLQHPNIVQIYDVGELDGLPYFSLEYIDGLSLDQKIHRQAQPPREAANLTETLSRAMHYAHENGIIHRDLKPANVLMTTDGKPKITDFGLAKRLEEDSSQTKSGTLMGTPSYMAPEQARGEIKDVGPLADVYSLGAMLYELLTGRPPFLASSAMDTIMQVTRDEAMAPTRIVPDTPRDLETICMKCLQKESGKRYSSALALAEDLERFQLGEPILARPVSGPERLWRWCRRNPRVALLTGAVAVLLISVTAVSVASAVRISQEKQETERQREEAVEQRNLADVAREQESKARELADVSAKVAGEQRELAVGALYGLVTKVENKLRGKEDMNDLRKDILKDAMEGLNRVSRSAETAPVADRTMGVALQRMGDACEEMGQTEEAMRHYKASLTIFKRLAPDNDWVPFNCAVSYDKLGGYSHEFFGDATAALDYYEKSLAHRQALAAHIQTPAVTPAMRNAALSASYIRLADLTRDLGDPTKSREYAQKALEQNEALLATDPTNAQAVHFLAACRYSLGKALAHLGQLDASRKDLARCLDVRQKAAKKDPTSAAAKRDLGAAYEALGDMELEQHNGQAAVEAYRNAHQLYAKVYEKERDNAEDQWYLAYSYYRLGRAYELLGDGAAARKEYAESLKLREVLAKTDPNNIQRQTELMVARALCGQHAEASRAAADIRKRVSKDSAFLYSVACGYALCIPAVAHGKGQLGSEERALQQHYADEAIETLRQAIAKGYKDRVSLETDQDLTPIQNDPRFQDLLAKMKKRQR